MTDKMYVDNICSEDIFINVGSFSVINLLFALVEYLVDQFMSLSLPLSNIQHTVNYKHHRPNPRGSNFTFSLLKQLIDLLSLMFTSWLYMYPVIYNTIVSLQMCRVEQLN